MQDSYSPKFGSSRIFRFQINKVRDESQLTEKQDGCMKSSLQLFEQEEETKNKSNTKTNSINNAPIHTCKKKRRNM